MDDLTRSLIIALSIFAIGSLGCINLFDDTVERPDLSGLECGDFSGEMPQMGYMWDDFEPLGSECPNVPIEPGFQGGFHITPAVWLPAEMQTGELTGVGTIRLTFVDGEIEPIEQSLEIFGSFWRPVGNGSAFDSRIVLPNSLVEDGGRWDVQLDIELEFDDAEQQPFSLSRSTEIYLEAQ